LSEERSCMIRKWYHKIHKKWLFDTTTCSGMMEGEP
jgi:hypothetical protein